MLDHVVDVALDRILGILDRASAEAGRLQQRLDLELFRVGELVPLPVEDLDAVVVGRVVGRRDDQPEVPRQQRDGWGGKDPREDGRAAGVDDPTSERLPRAPGRIHACRGRRARALGRTRAWRPVPGARPAPRSTLHRRPPGRHRSRTSAWAASPLRRGARRTSPHRDRPLEHPPRSQRGRKRRFPQGKRLALAELRRLARLVQAGLLALDLARVAREEALALERHAQLGIRLDERTGDPVPDGPGLAADAAAVHAYAQVVAALGIGSLERRRASVRCVARGK